MNKQVAHKPSHIVGIGASAGGLQAIEELVQRLAADTGVAFVIIQHLSPDYKSMMAELLGKFTSMPILKIEDGMTVQANHIYIIPPRKNIRIFHGKLLSTDQTARDQGQLNLPIDIFFESLAEDQKEKAIGVVLSGTGSDGTRGIKAIKEQGGLTIAQSEASAKFESMPYNAIASGQIDFVLNPSDVADAIHKYVSHPFATAKVPHIATAESENGLTKVFSILRDRHRVDFTNYKMNTIVRRIERRITIHQLEDLDDYIHMLVEQPKEVDLLFQELLIGVTSFCRDQEVFDYLEDNVLSDLVTTAAKRENREVRVWVAGCSTGEEAYTMSMYCHHTVEKLNLNVKLKVFATDVDPQAIQKAGSSSYPSSIAADIPQKFLSKYFTKNGENYQINRDIRESVVFAQHDLLRDPPFTNIDLISCRNLLIYFQPVLQKKVFELFNFSLRRNGILVLGTSESLGDMEHHFEPKSSRLKIYSLKGKTTTLPLGRVPLREPSTQYVESNRYLTGESSTSSRLNEERFYDRLLHAFTSYELLPFVVLTDEDMRVTHTYGESAGVVQLSGGRVALEISKMVVRELSVPITTGLQNCIKSNNPVSLTNVSFKAENGEKKTVDIRVLPVMPTRGNQHAYYCVVFNDASKKYTFDEQEYDIAAQSEQRIYDLEQELQFSRESLQATVEELETSNEELQATNEELLASNEELQSTNEELQSVNEELYTVNTEYQSKITELTVLNNDMDNLYSSTDTAAIFLDVDLEIRKFTPKLSQIIPVIASDIGRPINHLSTNINDEIDLVHIAKDVVDKQVIIEHEFMTSDNRWYLIKAKPYNISARVNAGVVISLFDITELKQTQNQLDRQLKREVNVLSNMITRTSDFVCELDDNLTLLTTSPGAMQWFGNHDVERVADIETLLSLKAGHISALCERVISDSLSVEKNIELTPPGGEEKSSFIINIERLALGIDKSSLLLSLYPTSNA